MEEVLASFRAEPSNAQTTSKAALKRPKVRKAAATDKIVKEVGFCIVSAQSQKNKKNPRVE